MAESPVPHPHPDPPLEGEGEKHHRAKGRNSLPFKGRAGVGLYRMVGKRRRNSLPFKGRAGVGMGIAPQSLENLSPSFCIPSRL